MITTKQQILLKGVTLKNKKSDENQIFVSIDFCSRGGK